MNKMIDAILNGLSAQYAGEYLSANDKARTLGSYPLENRQVPSSSEPRIIMPKDVNDDKRHIAVLCNDVTNQNVINYVLGNANDCSVDILYHGLHHFPSSKSFYTQARNSFSDNNVDVTIVKLINDSIYEIKEYLINQRSLQYLVTDSSNKLMSSFLSNKSITRELQIPIVLIN